jgi:large subunit ribosomal protein L35
MPKMKSNRSAARRFSFTGTGKVKYAKANKRHILTKKSSKRKRRLAQNAVLGDCDAGHIAKLLPYGR